MPPSKDACLICSRRFYGRQRFLRCTECQLRAHTKCVCFPETERTFLQREVSSFVCQSCAKINGGARPNVSGVVSGDSDDQFARSPPPPSASPTRPVTLPASSPDGLDARGDASLQSLRSLLLDALEGISFLTEEVASLGEDNARLRRDQRQQAELQAGSIACLRAEVRSLRDVLGKRARVDAEVQAGPCGGKTFAAALRFPPASALAAKSAGAPANGMTKGNALLGKPNPMSPQAPVSALVSVASEDDPLPVKPNPVSPKTRIPAQAGASVACKLSVAPSSSRRRALFVTKLDPVTTSTDIVGHLCSLDVENLKCHRLKTRYNTYASFHVSVAAEDFEKLSDPALWPKDCLFKPFRGALRQELLHSSEEA
ncbi:unnamed protein product, partial [Ixodes pacificus]